MDGLKKGLKGSEVLFRKIVLKEGLNFFNFKNKGVNSMVGS